MIRLIIQGIGFILLFVGIVGVLTPIPFGIFFLILAMLFLIPTTPAVLRGVRHLRRRYPAFDGRMLALTRRLPYPYRRIFRRTEVDEFF
jgi:hypothetical protein